MVEYQEQHPTLDILIHGELGAASSIFTHVRYFHVGFPIFGVGWISTLEEDRIHDHGF